MKLYIAVLDEFPDYMVPTLVAHSMLNAHIKFENNKKYKEWLNNSFKKCVLRVSEKEFNKIKELPLVHLGNENKTLNGKYSCAVICPCDDKDIPNVLKFAKLWKPKDSDKLLVQKLDINDPGIFIFKLKHSIPPKKMERIKIDLSRSINKFSSESKCILLGPEFS